MNAVPPPFVGLSVRMVMSGFVFGALVAVILGLVFQCVSCTAMIDLVGYVGFWCFGALFFWFWG